MMGRAPVGVSCGQGCELKWLASTNCRVPAMHLQGQEKHARWVVQPKQSTAALWVRFTRLLAAPGCSPQPTAREPRPRPSSSIAEDPRPMSIPRPRSRKRIVTVPYRRCHHQVSGQNPLARYLSQGPTRSRFLLAFSLAAQLPRGRNGSFHGLTIKNPSLAGKLPAKHAGRKRVGKGARETRGERGIDWLGAR